MGVAVEPFVLKPNDNFNPLFKFNHQPSFPRRSSLSHPSVASPLSPPHYSCSTGTVTNSTLPPTRTAQTPRHGHTHNRHQIEVEPTGYSSSNIRPEAQKFRSRSRGRNPACPKMSHSKASSYTNKQRLTPKFPSPSHRRCCDRQITRQLRFSVGGSTPIPDPSSLTYRWQAYYTHCTPAPILILLRVITSLVYVQVPCIDCFISFIFPCSISSIKDGLMTTPQHG